MDILVIGAAGRTGRAVVDRAIRDGHVVTALVRTDRGDNRPGVVVRTGDAMNADVLDAAMGGQDAVIDTVGGTTPYRRTTLETDVVRTTLAAMRAHAVRRLVVTSSVGVGDSIANASPLLRILVRTFLRGSTQDKADLEMAVRSSGLDWIITRPAVLTDKPATGEVRVVTPAGREKARSITRADLADFLVAQVTSDEYLGRSVTIANP